MPRNMNNLKRPPTQIHLITVIYRQKAPFALVQFVINRRLGRMHKENRKKAISGNMIPIGVCIEKFTGLIVLQAAADIQPRSAGVND